MGLASNASAQLSAGVYGGATTDKQSTYMVMADYGSRVDVEPWIQSYGSLVQFGADVIVIPSRVGFVVGANSNSAGARAGVALNLFGAQVRFMKHTSGAYQGVAYYNINLNKKFYVQLWAAPAFDSKFNESGSAYLVGVGYNIK